MNRNYMVAAFFAMMFTLPARGYFPGEKVSASEQMNMSSPRITLITSERIEYETPTDEEVILSVYDVSGNAVPNRGMTSEGQHPVNGRGGFVIAVDPVPSGMYFITLRNSSGIVARGIVHLR